MRLSVTEASFSKTLVLQTLLLQTDMELQMSKRTSTQVSASLTGQASFFRIHFPDKVELDMSAAASSVLMAHLK